MIIDNEIFIGILGMVGGALGVAFAEHKSSDNKTAKALDRLSDRIDPFITDASTRITRVEESCDTNHSNIVSMDTRLTCVERVVGIEPKEIKG